MGVGIIDAQTIDRVNILEATRLAMVAALQALAFVPELVFTDWVVIDGPWPQRNLVRGDARSASVAAASIVAKVTRIRIMDAADREFPKYGFGRHKGYATEEHRSALALHGPCPPPPAPLPRGRGGAIDSGRALRLISPAEAGGLE